MMMRLVGVVAVCALLGACQTLSKEECVAADWRVIGEQDGAAGYSSQDRFARHVKACQRAGIIPDQTRWFQGYQQGLPRYCTPLNGLAVGSQGKSYANVCPVDLDAGFREGYSLGNAYYRTQSGISSKQSQIRGIEQTIRDDEKLIRTETAASSDIRRRIDADRWRIRDLEREIGRLQSDLRRVEDDMADFRYARGGRS